MKIKYITNVRIPTTRAQGYAIMKMCEEFSSNGVDVELIVPNRRNNESEEDPFKFYGIKNNFKIRKIFSTDLLGPYEAFGKAFYWIDMLSFLVSLKIKNILNSEDVLYTRDYLIPLLINNRGKTYLEIHDLPKNKFIIKYIAGKINKFFVLNQFLKEELIKIGVSGDMIHIFPSGVDIESIDIKIDKEGARNKVGLPINKKIVMYTGHFYGWKGATTLAEVAKFLKDYIFVFIGGVEPELSQFKNTYKLENITTFPFKERREIPYFLKSADILVVPNSRNSEISSKYTSPLKMLEYMASGTPVLASDLPSIRQTLDESNSYLAIPDDVDSFKMRIEKIFSDYENALLKAKKAKTDVVKYSWEVRAKNILALIS